jgi:hypothetical protein
MAPSIITVSQSSAEFGESGPSATNGLQATRILNNASDTVFAAWDLTAAEFDVSIEFSVPTKIQQRLMRPDFSESVFGDDERTKVSSKDVKAGGKYSCKLCP